MSAFPKHHFFTKVWTESLCATVEYEDGDSWTGPASEIHLVPEWEAQPVNLVRSSSSGLLHAGRDQNTSGLAVIAIVFLILVHMLIQGFVPANLSGEVQMWYDLPLCPSSSKSADGSPKYELRMEEPGLGGFDGTFDTVCENSCRSPNDGDCDDGGIGSAYAYCALGSDCTDCGGRERPESLPGFACPAVPLSRPSQPAVISLELLDGFRPGNAYAPAMILPTGGSALLTVSIEDSKGNLLIAPLTLQLGPAEATTFPWGTAAVMPPMPPASMPAPAPAAALVAAYPHPAAGERRLLKGGGASGGFSGGRASTYGAGRWGAAGSSIHTTRARVPPAFVSRGGGGSSASRVPSPNGYSAARIGSYYYGRGAVPPGARFHVLRQGQFRCFSCVWPMHTHGYYGSGCTTGGRVECGQAIAYQADQSMDRYELAEATFLAPKDESFWPLTLTVTRADVYGASPVAVVRTGPTVAVGPTATDQSTAANSGAGVSGASSQSLLLSFSTDDGDATLFWSDLVLQWTEFLILLLFFCPFFVVLCPAPCMYCLCGCLAKCRRVLARRSESSMV